MVTAVAAWAVAAAWLWRQHISGGGGSMVVAVATRQQRRSSAAVAAEAGNGGGSVVVLPLAGAIKSVRLYWCRMVGVEEADS